MRNPIPESIRLWLYLAAACTLTVAAGGTIPHPYLSWLLSAAACLNVLAAANVVLPGSKPDIDSMPPEES